MKKIMFNDKYMLTNLVLKGRKDETRRIIELPKGVSPDDIDEELIYFNKEGHAIFTSRKHGSFKVPFKYKEGEIVAVAQRYADIPMEHFMKDLDEKQRFWQKRLVKESAGWNNKMFVCAEAMPHRIKIHKIYIQRLQDIRDESCVKEGIGRIVVETSHGMKIKYIHGGTLKAIQIMDFDTPQKAFAHLIDGIAGRGTWNKNPWVIAYEFELL